MHVRAGWLIPSGIPVLLGVRLLGPQPPRALVITSSHACLQGGFCLGGIPQGAHGRKRFLNEIVLVAEFGN